MIPDPLEMVAGEVGAHELDLTKPGVREVAQ